MRLRVLLFGLLLSGSVHAQTARPVVARPPLTAVTLFLNAAQLTHQGSVSLPAGTSQVLVRDLARGLEEETLEVRFGAGAELVDVGAEVDELPAVPANQLVQDSINRLSAERERTKAELAALQEERAFWLANRTLPAGTQTGWSAELQKGATLLRTRLVANQLETNRLNARDAELSRKIAGMETRLSNDDEPSNDDVVLTVRTERAGSFPLTVRYFNNHSERRVHWEPQLDIRSDDTARKLSFVKRGRIYNSTRLDWQRVRVTLVDQMLAADVSRPTLAPWSLDFNGGDQIGEGRIDEFVVKGAAEGKAAAAPQSNRYELPEPVTLPEKGRRTVSLAAVTLPARPEFLAVPKLSDKVFLQVKVTGWEGLQLPEQADVYYRGAYAGKTELETEAYNDSLELSLGYDERISVRRAKLEDISSKVGLGGTRRVHLAYELNVRNQHPQAVRIRVLDQVPVPGDKAIQVKLLETSGAQLEERTGKLTWLLTLAPNTNQKLKFSFDVDYPQEKKVEIIQHRRRISTLKTR